MTCNQTRTPAEWHWWHSERAIHDLCVIQYSIVKNPFANIRSYKNSLPQIHAYIAYPNLFSKIALYFNRDYLSWCVFNRSIVFTHEMMIGHCVFIFWSIVQPFQAILSYHWIDRQWDFRNVNWTLAVNSIVSLSKYANNR